MQSSRTTKEHNTLAVTYEGGKSCQWKGKTSQQANKETSDQVGESHSCRELPNIANPRNGLRSRQTRPVDTPLWAHSELFKPRESRACLPRKTHLVMEAHHRSHKTCGHLSFTDARLGPQEAFEKFSMTVNVGMFTHHGMVDTTHTVHVRSPLEERIPDHSTSFNDRRVVFRGHQCGSFNHTVLNSGVVAQEDIRDSSAVQHSRMSAGHKASPTTNGHEIMERNHKYVRELRVPLGVNMLRGDAHD